MAVWNFKESPESSVITEQKIINNLGWIGYVTHDVDDESWQFLELSKKLPAIDDAAVVSLRNIIDLDPSISDLADLPLGWHAWREAKESPWLRAKK